MPRRATLRPEVRAALALEEAGELQEAARVFEYAGEHAQAALLRLEHAKTLRDVGERIDVLREGSARNPGTTPEGRRLHLTLAEALLDLSEHAGDTAQRRTLQLEAAQALEEADESGRAGEIYEGLGLLRRAVKAYQNAGALERLELVLEVLERADQHLESQRAFERDIDQAIAEGRRRYAHLQLLERVVSEVVPPSTTTALARSEAGLPARAAAPPGWIARLQHLESRLLSRPQLDLRWGDGHVTSIRGTPRLRLGRAPEVDLVLADPTLSRHHVELSLDHEGPRPRLVATDLGSKVGTFWQGEPLVPGEPMPLLESGELALGLTAPIELHRVEDRDGAPRGAFLRPPQSDRWWLFLPGGGPLWLAPDIRVPARILFDRGYVILDFASRVAATLQGHALPVGANIELVLGDRVALVGVPLTLEVVA